MVRLFSGQTFLYSDWMTNLPIELQEMQLTEIAIPGSHDSATYSLKENELFIGSLKQQVILITSTTPIIQIYIKAYLGLTIYRFAKRDQNLKRKSFFL